MLILLLRLTSIVYVIVGLTHFIMGTGADSLVGANLDAMTLSNATLDSQSRFYGTSFGMTGLLLWLASAQFAASKTIIYCLMLALFAGGLARLVSIAQFGAPSHFTLFLLATEILTPLLVALLMRRSVAKH
jgi:Domain of unknown function (DUF4345)